ncbi:MAG: FtsQ-type POTRA domain-containing protein [Betaproteobacteria bacterium]|nr:FtsQ-type POTRA domain-containing protein [Betaproteobacteria bacterium]
MWHNPRLLNALADLLIGVASLLFAFSGAQLLLRSSLFPLREVTVAGEFSHVPRAAIERAATARVAGNFFATDLAQLRSGFEQLPWVRRVSVRRVWPDRIEVRLEEHLALARWGDAGLVNTFGERFAAMSEATLPLFVGPAGSESEVAKRYRAFAGIIAPLEVRIERVVLTPRYSWQLRLANGLALELGRDLASDRAERRLRRFVASHASTLGRIARSHEYVDLRYPNGFALRVPELKTPEQGKAHDAAPRALHPATG